MKSFITSLAIILGMPTFLALTAILNGYVLSILWRWFLVPTLDLPAISIVQAIGISLVIGYLTDHSSGKSDDRKSDNLIANIFTISLKPLMALFIGWIVKLFL